MTTYKRELKLVLDDAKEVSKLLTKAEKQIGELQETIEEINGINIMLIEYASFVLKQKEN